MITFSNCKINLGLNIIAKRSDGFHDLESVFYPVKWNDAIEVELNPSGSSKIELVQYSASPTTNNKENLCVKAYDLLDSKFNLPAIKLHLLKTISVGAGLGGGSSNASATLILLNKFFNLDISNPDLKSFAALLGSDCPFFIDNTPSFVQGRGEIIHPIHLDLSEYSILLINPRIHISTAEAFSKIVPKKNEFDLSKKLLETNPREWKTFLTNDFEKSAIEKHPLIETLKDSMYKQGALYSSMSGSGSTVYGIFEDDTDAEKVLQKNRELICKLIYSKNYLKTFV